VQYKYVIFCLLLIAYLFTCVRSLLRNVSSIYAQFSANLSIFNNKFFYRFLTIWFVVYHEFPLTMFF
jgi:hypothetical protein